MPTLPLEKPVIAFDINSSAEIIENNKTGYLVEKFDVNQYAEKLEYLINNTDVREKFGMEGKKRVIENFSQEKSINELEKQLIYN